MGKLLLRSICRIAGHRIHNLSSSCDESIDWCSRCGIVRRSVRALAWDEGQTDYVYKWRVMEHWRSIEDFEEDVLNKKKEEK